MLRSFETKINVAVEVSTVWDIVSSSCFVKDFVKTDQGRSSC